jgi:hypothetical protein
MASNHFKLRRLQRELIINQNKAEVLLLMELLWAVGAGTVLHACGIVVNSLDTTLLLGIHPFARKAILYNTMIVNKHMMKMLKSMSSEKIDNQKINKAYVMISVNILIAA